MPEVPPLPDLLLVFNALPGANLLLAPDLRIVAASDDYLAATLTERATIVGQHIFDAFPDNPQAPQAQAVPNVRASILQVLATRQPHEMAPQHYDVPDRTQPGRFVERHWLPRHSPVLDAQGQVQFIIQSVQDITASREAQRQLHESRASEQVARADAAQQRSDFQYFLEQAPVAVAVYHGPEFRIAMANAATLAIWGRPLEDVLQRPVFEVLPEAAAPEIIALFERVFNTGVAQMSYEQPTTIYRHGRQEVVYWNTVLEPQRDAAGHVSGIFTVGTDVTAQVRARQQVEQLNQDLEVRVQERTRQLEAARAATERQRRQWYELFRRAPASICVFDGPEWVYEFVNPGYQAMFPGRALLGKRLVDALPEVADQPLMDILHRVYDTGEPFEASEVLVPLARTEGGPVEDIYFDLTYQARYNEVGQIDGFVTYAYDVTAQVLARRERENHRQQLQRLFLEAPAAICMLSGPELVYEFVNPNYQQFFPERQLLGKPLREALPELADHAAYHTMRHVLDSGETVWQQALHVPVARTEDGVLEDRYFNYIQQPRYDEQGRVVGVLVFGFEVTELVEARQQVERLNQKLTATNEDLNASNAQLTRTNVDLDTFVYTASHDLKAPITNIESIVLALRETLPSDMQQEGLVSHLLNLLDNTVARFQVTIGQLTDIARLQLAHDGPTEPVVLAPVVQAVRLDLMPAIAAAGAQLTVAVPDELVVSFSPSNLRSIVYNLLSNAIKYRALDRPARVHVSATLTEAGVMLAVQDNGLGMSELQQRQLFGLFQRLHTHVEGTGVGLYISKRLIENAGGTIRVQSQLNEGTTFTVTFPT